MKAILYDFENTKVVIKRIKHGANLNPLGVVYIDDRLFHQSDCDWCAKMRIAIREFKQDTDQDFQKENS